MQIESLFPQAIIGLSKLEVNPDKVLKYLENIEFNITNASLQNKENVYISKNFNVFEDIIYLRDEIYINVKNYLNNIMKFKIDFQFTTSWATKTLPNGFSLKHMHQHSLLSGVYYPVGDENFSITFHKREGFWGIPTIEDNSLNADWYNIKINKNGVLILFPSHLDHSIARNLSEKTRYSIAFNTLPLGQVGTGDGGVNFK
jgi:uncharacterized protein (TIGR02466 family)